LKQTKKTYEQSKSKNLSGEMMTTPQKPKKKMGRPRKWIKMPVSRPSPVSTPVLEAPEEPETHIPGTEETPYGGATGGEGGFEEALKGAGEEPEKPEGPPPQPGPSKPTPVDPAEIEALINFCDMTTVMTCRGFAISRGVQWTQVLQRECMLNDGEKAQLAMTAPAAMPYIRKLMLHLDKFAAGLFFLSYSFMLAGRFSAIKSRAPKPMPKKETDGRQTPPDNGTHGFVPAPSINVPGETVN
jgi:hypothetical protein